MSTPRPPESSLDVHPTRQQLDELDDLLRRMLELPVGAPEGPADSAEPPQEAPVREPSPSAPPVSYVAVETGGSEQAPAAADPPQKDAEGWIPFRSSWQPSPQTWGPLAESWHQARTGARPAPDPMPAAAPPPPPAAAPLPPPAADPPAIVEPARSTGVPPVEEQNRPDACATSTPGPHRVLAPLVWFNRAFDATLAPLGPVGRWLHGPAGRTLLGVAGLLCLAAAAALALRP